MKAAHKILNIIIAVLMLTLGNQVKAQEQGYQWSKWFEGQRINNVLIDRVLDSYIDSLGNTYVFGRFGKDARQGGLNTPYICPMDSISGYINGNVQGVFLAKIDSVGNVIWWKSARSATSVTIPWNMVVKDNKITIAFDITFGSWLYFFDTLLTSSGEHFYQWGITTYFVTFDMNGNVVDIHDIRLHAIPGSASTTTRFCSLGFLHSRFGIDEENNFHIFSCSEYARDDSLHKAYFIVDGDTNRKYPLNVNTMNGIYFSSSVYYKMDSNWTLQTSRYMIDSITGWQLDCLGPGLANLLINHVVVDNNELYVNGFFECKDAYNIVQEISDTESFIAQIHLDSLHYLQIDNIRDFELMPFVLKMNTNGDIVWIQQIYTIAPTYDGINYFEEVHGLAIDSGSVFFSSCPNAYTDSDTDMILFYLDKEHEIPLVNHVPTTVLITSYDKTTGIPIDYYWIDTTKLHTSTTIHSQGDELILDINYIFLTRSELCKINKHNKLISTLFSIESNQLSTINNMSINDNGWILRGNIGSRTYIDDSIFVGNYSEAAVMTFYYDSSLDLRRRPCPQVDSLWGSISGLVATLSWNGQSGIADYELSYIPEGGNWDNAFTCETSDTTATLTLLYDRCYQFRIRGHCTRKGKPYSSWSEPFTICPEAGIEGIGGTGAIALSPNPATGRVQVLGLGEELKQIEVIDMKGNVVSTFSNTTTFDITDLPQGSYLVKLHTAAGTTLHHKLVKQ